MGPPLDELAHYGVKGMKWGVRRETKRAAESNARAFFESMSHPDVERSVVTPITEKEYRNFSSAPIKLGTEFNRLARNGKADLRDIAYVSKTEDDRIRYNVLMGASKKSADLKIKTSSMAISPSMKERVDTYIETLGQDLPSKNGKAMTKGRDHLQRIDHRAAKALNDRELGLATYKAWAQTQEGLKTPLETAYFENLRKKGYNAVIDDADRGIVSDLPIILFPKESGARVTEIKPLSMDDLIESKLRVKPVGYK